MIRILIAGAILVSLMGEADAEQVCAAYVGQTVSPQRLQTVMATYSKLPVKGEFETTAAYNERRKAAITPQGTSITIAVPPQHDPSFIYDADTQLLQVRLAAFGGHIIQASGIAIAAPQMPPHSTYNIDAVLESTSKVSGSYVGQNAFGAKTKVTKRELSTLAIFDRSDPKSLLTDYRINYLFETMDQKHSVVGGIPMSAADAKVMKPSLKVALAVMPKEPYLIQGTRSSGDVTIEDPDDVTEHFSILIADIQCGLVLDGKNNVIAAYQTRSGSLSDSAVKRGDGDLEPVLRSQTLPPYPTVSFRLGEQGVTELAVTVDTEGSAKEVSVKKSSGSNRLDQAAIDYVRSHWRWKPPARVSETTATVTWDLKKAY